MDHVTVSPSGVPLYLRSGEVFRDMKANNEDLTLPRNCFKQSTNVKRFEDVRLLLSTLAFWKVRIIPPALVQFCARNHAAKEHIASIFSEFELQLSFVSFLRGLMDSISVSDSVHNTTTINATEIVWSNSEEANAIKICAFQFNALHEEIWNSQTTAFAAQSGQLKTFAFLHEMGCPWDASTSTAAAEHGCLECLRYAHEHGCAWTEETLHSALSAGPHAECVRYAVENRCPGYKRACEAFAGNLNSLQCAHAAGSPLTPMCYERAVASVDCAKYLHENGIAWHTETCTWAAKEGNIESLQFAHEHGASWGFATVSSAAKRGQLGCLNYALKNGCPSFSLFYPSVCTVAAEAGQLDCLVCARENGCWWSSSTATAAARGGHLHCLTYLHENGCPWGLRTCKAAARAGSLECLRYAHEHGCPWDGLVLEVARGECADYAREHHCPQEEWDDEMIGRCCCPCLYYWCGPL